MRRFQSYGPSIVVAIAATLTLLFGPSAVQTLQAARTSALVTLAQDRLDQDDLLERINQSIRDLAQAVEPSVVYVDVLVRSPRGAMGNSNGSGWVFDANGHIVTNAHVIDGAERITVQFYDGRVRRANLVGMDRSTDVAVLKVDQDDSLLFPARRATAQPVFQGDKVFAFGSPFGFKFSMSEGIVSGLGRTARTSRSIGYTNYIQTDAAINPGNSGGPLVDVNGKVIGMNTAIITDRGRGGFDPNTGVSGGISFAIPLDTIESVASQLMGAGYVLKGFLGVSLAELNPVNAEAAGFNEGGGVVIENVSPGTPADEAGLNANDIVIEVNGRRSPRVHVMQSLIGNRQPGEQITLTVWRAGEIIDVPVTLGAARYNAAGQLQQVTPEVARALAGENDRFDTLATAIARFGLTSLTDDDAGVRVESVREDSAAEQAGYQPGLLIVAVGETPVASRVDLFTELARLTVSDGPRTIPAVVRTPRGDLAQLDLMLAQ